MLRWCKLYKTFVKKNAWMIIRVPEAKSAVHMAAVKCACHHYSNKQIIYLYNFATVVYKIKNRPLILL